MMVRLILAAALALFAPGAHACNASYPCPANSGGSQIKIDLGGGSTYTSGYDSQGHYRDSTTTQLGAGSSYTSGVDAQGHFYDKNTIDLGGGSTYSQCSTADCE